MSDYISRQELIEKADRLFKEPPRNSDFLTMMEAGYNHAVADVIVIAKNLPTADVRENKAGHWKIRKFGADAKCSECGRSFSDVYDIENYDRYCRHCGCKMVRIETEQFGK